MMGLSVELLYPIQNNSATRMSGELHASPHNDVVKYLQISSKAINNPSIYFPIDIIDGLSKKTRGELFIIGG